MAVSVVQQQALRGPRLAIAVDDVEIQLLLEGLVRLVGHDFRDHDPALVRRRIEAAMAAEGAATVSALQDRAFHDDECLTRLLVELGSRKSSMFFEPQSFAVLRAMVAPLLRTYPFLRVWHVGCSSGEETYSLAALFTEAGIYDRVKIYATDAVDALVSVARAGAYSAERAASFASNYRGSGGTGSLEAFVAHEGQSLVVDAALKKNIVFATHNVVSDASFNEFHLVFCNHVLSQFNSTLQSAVHQLLYGSLVRLGFLMVGSGETLANCPQEAHYRAIDARAGVYRRMR